MSRSFYELASFYEVKAKRAMNRTKTQPINSPQPIFSLSLQQNIILYSAQNARKIKARTAKSKTAAYRHKKQKRTIRPGAAVKKENIYSVQTLSIQTRSALRHGSARSYKR